MDPFVLTSKLRDSFSILRLERLKKVHRSSVRHSPLTISDFEKPQCVVYRGLRVKLTHGTC